MSVFDKLIHQKDTYDREALEMLGSFIRQLDSKSGKTDPDKASRDLKYVRALQRTRLTSKHAAIRYSYNLTPQSFRFVNWKLDTDNRYKVRIPFYELDTQTVFSVNSRKKKTVKERQKIYAYAVRLTGQQTGAYYCCPNCGAVSKVEELLSGCPYCRTQYLMNDLYPKISSIYTQKELDIDKHVKRDVAVFTLLLTAITFFLNYHDYMAIFNGTYTASDPVTMLLSLPITVGVGVIVGILAANLAISFRLLFKAISTSGWHRKTLRAGRVLPDFIRRYEPSFSLDYFITKLIYLTQVMVYTENYANCALYAGEPMENRWDDLIDARYRGFVNVHNCFEQNGYVYVDVSISMDNVYLHGGRVKRRNEAFRMLLRKSATAETDYGFSIHSINCRSCAGSFDAAKEKRCPYCGSEYAIDSYDWVVVRFESE